MSPKKVVVEPKHIDVSPEDRTFLSTGVLALDIGLGGGIVEGAITGLFAIKSGGKTTTCVNATRSAIAKYPNKKVLYISTESGGITEARMDAMGVDMSKVDLLHESTAEIIDGYLFKASGMYNVAKNKYSLIVLDSINNMTNEVELTTDSLGYNTSASKRNASLLKKLTVELFKRYHEDSSSPLTVLMTLQAAANMDVTAFEKYVPKGGHSILHNASYIIQFNSREANFQATKDKLLKVGTTDYALDYVANHPVVSKFADNQKPWLITNAVLIKNRGLFRNASAYVISGLNASLTLDAPEEAKLKVGQEYLPVTLYDLVSCSNIDLREGNGRVPCIGIETGSKNKLVKVLALGLDPTKNVVVDYKKLITCIVIKMRLAIKKQIPKLDILPKDNYICGMFFDRDEFYALAEELEKKADEELAISLAEYHKSLFDDL